MIEYELLFRSWSKELKRYTKFSSVHIDDNLLTHYGNDLFNKDIIIEQWTGKLDKNGTKIFVGDIVRVVRFEGQEDWKGVVEYYPPSYRINQSRTINGLFVETAEMSPALRYTSDCLLVIGNIHENPELLGR